MYTFPAELWNELADEFNLRHDHRDPGSLFAARCISLTGRLGDLLRFAAACRHAADRAGLPAGDLVDALAKSVRVADSGNDHIFYFPHVTLAGQTDPAEP